MNTAVTTLHELADRLARLRADPRYYDHFVEERSELVAALRAVALPNPCFCQHQALPGRTLRLMPEGERARRWAAVLRAKELVQSRQFPVTTVRSSPFVALAVAADPRADECLRRAMALLAAERAERSKLERLLDQARTAKRPRR